MRSLGIDIGGTSVKLAFLQDGQVLWRGKSQPYARPTTDQLVAAMKQATDGRDAHADVVGMCVPGLLNKDKSRVEISVNVPGLLDAPLVEFVTRAFDTRAPVRIVNDAVAHASDIIRTRHLHGRVLSIGIGTGVGMGVFDDGVPLIVEGASPGHIGQVDVSIEGEPVIGPDGGAGSLEGYLAVPALRKRYGEDFSSRLGSLSIDEPPLKALVRAIRIVHAIYRPHHIVLVGGIGIRLKPIVPLIKGAVNHQLTSVARPDWSLSTGEHDHHAAIGAARLAADERG